MANQIFTIGYEGASSDQVFRALEEAGVDALIDVRADVGRRKAFDTNALRSECQKRNMWYWWFPELGVPREERPRIRKEMNKSLRLGARMLAEFYCINVIAFGKGYERLLFLEKGIYAGRINCFLCYERDHLICHRKLLAEALQKLVPGSEIVHLAPAEVSQGAGQ